MKSLLEWVLATVKCINCGSTDIKFLYNVPGSRRLNKYKCNSCGCTFSA